MEYFIHPIQSRFLDEDYERLYRAETNMGRLVNYFSILAIFIACLGLFGLASFTAEQRTKEIGIRKVLGASVPVLTFSMCQDFLKLVLAANILAWPAAYYAMNGWLDNFAYRTGLSYSTFILAGFMAIIIAIFTVGYQALKPHGQTRSIRSGMNEISGRRSRLIRQRRTCLRQAAVET